jgi:uncharacterized protein YeaO (DUF488 family)
MSHGIAIKRVYEPPAETDGQRVLVDRLWPRGLSKEKLDLALWLKEIAPSTELRKWFHHDPDKWSEFQKRFRAELDVNGDLVEELRGLIAKGKVTLVYSAHDAMHNNAVVLAEYLQEAK